jgi:hypothetical protein
MLIGYAGSGGSHRVERTTEVQRGDPSAARILAAKNAAAAYRATNYSGQLRASSRPPNRATFSAATMTTGPDGEGNIFREETDSPLYADERNFYNVETWTQSHLAGLLE